MAQETQPSDAEIWQALGSVLDPELDEPITDLAFVTEAVGLGSGRVRVRLRLPTYFCAPNFAYLMVADARDAVMELPGVEAADVKLEDHMASEEINAGVAASAGFVGSFPKQARDELDDLRMTFRRKAYLASLDRMAKRLGAGEGGGVDPVGLTLGDLPECPQRTGLLRRRRDLGLPTEDASPLLLDEHGEVITAADAPLRLRFARSVRISIDGNAGWCRGLLKERYPDGSGTPHKVGVHAR